MFKTDKHTYKRDGSTASPNNSIDSFRKKLIRVQPRNEERGITGIMVDATNDFIVLEHRDGRRTIVSIKDIVSIAELPQPADGYGRSV